MIFGLHVAKYNPQLLSKVFDDKTGTWITKKIKGKCTNCHKAIPEGVVIVTQNYTTRYGGGTHKYCPACSEAGVKELMAETKHLKLRAKIGWDHY